MSTQKRRIIIAEDNPGLARVLTFKFKSCGYDPVSCRNGGIAWETFSSDESIEAIISDHEMPIMTGVELIQRVRESKSQIPCFLVTGRQLELSSDPRIAELNVTHVFAKPFSPAEIVSAVGKALEQVAGESTKDDAPEMPVLPHGSSPSTGVRA